MSYPKIITIPKPLFKVGQRVYAANEGEEKYSHKAEIIWREYVFDDKRDYGYWYYTVRFEEAFQSQRVIEDAFEKVRNSYYIRSW